MLPTATAAHGEVLTARFYTYIAGHAHTGYAAFGISFFLLFYLYVHMVARGTEGHEYHHVVDTRQGIALGCDISNYNILEQGEGFAFS